jgi:cobalt-zinc-cadmium efflux system protein
MSHDHSHHKGHGHAHSHAQGHSHGHDAGQASARGLGWAAVLTGGFMVAEAIAGALSGSLALIADAGHMLADAASLGLAWLAVGLSRRPADQRRTYGSHRFQVLAAYSNGLTMFFIAVAVTWEAVHRLREPTQVLGGPMLVVAILGLAVNVAAFLVLHGAERENLNVRGAILHVLGDLLGSAAAIVAAVVILWTGWTPIDPLLSVLVACIILRSAWFLVRESGHILLEGAPDHLDVDQISADLVAAVPGVQDVHHVHAWSLTPDRPMLTLHARIADLGDSEHITHAIKARLRERFGVDHVTVQIERVPCVGEACSRTD